jgi:hypothetical protein
VQTEKEQKRFLVKYHELHTVVIEAPTIVAACQQAQARVAKLPAGSILLEIRVEPEIEKT